MNSQKQWGFTIIELILFLGITGALFAGLMVGVNTNINTQRYKESAVSYKTLLEQQYSAVEYPSNSRDGNWSCDGATGVTPNPTAGLPRGTSDCVLLGRYVEIKDNGSKTETGDVVGIDPGESADSLTGDLAVLRAYTPRLSPINVEERSLAWQSRLDVSGEGTSAASFLILRSPQSGIIRTFGMNETLPSQIVNVLTDTNAASVIKNCVVPSGFVAVPTHSVTVNAAIGSANGITLNGNDETC